MTNLKTKNKILCKECICLPSCISKHKEYEHLLFPLVEVFRQCDTMWNKCINSEYYNDTKKWWYGLINKNNKKGDNFK